MRKALSQTGQATVTFADELDAALVDQAYGYVRDAVGECLQTAAGQQAVVIACALSGLGGADERTPRSPPY